MLFEPNIIGTIGTLLIVLSYFLLQIEKINAYDLNYSVMNLIGTLFLIYSLIHNWNFPSFLIEIFWLSISMIGISKWLVRNKTK